MIDALRVRGYRGLSQFDMADLGSVNLLVGRNNSGKTSVLEALHILSSGGDPSAALQHCRRRGELLGDLRDVRYSVADVEVAHLFYGHEIASGSEFCVSAPSGTPFREVSFEIQEANEREQDLFGPPNSEAEALGGVLVLRILTSPTLASPVALPLTRRGGISLDSIDLSRRILRRARNAVTNSLYVSTESLTANELTRLWEDVQLTPSEDLVLRALRYMDENIERIASISTYRLNDSTRGGFKVKMRNYAEPFPIGSLGGGIWRMLAMALAITQCQGGMLLIDEIDTGLHHTVLTDMWRLIVSASKDFDVQVFATTHSDDCIRSLAGVFRSGSLREEDVTIQRVESGRRKSVPYSGREILIAADSSIELR